MIYPIVKYGNPVLEKPATPVTAFDHELKKLVDDMFESMYAAHGVGLAAPQIGISKRLAVIDVTFKEDPDAKLVLANPEIIHVEGRQTGSEGCLSIPEFREQVIRGKKVTDALATLQFLPHRAAREFAKVVKSAAANAESNFNLDPTELYVVRVTADKGRTLRRFRPKARGRVGPILKRSSHLTVIVAERG